MPNYFSNMCFLEYGNQKFLVDKFSGFSTVDFCYKICGGNIHIKYFMNIYFSGEKLELSKICTIPTHHKYSSSRWSIFNDETDEFQFIYRNGENGNNLYEQFKKLSGKSHLHFIKNFFPLKFYLVLSFGTFLYFFIFLDSVLAVLSYT